MVNCYINGELVTTNGKILYTRNRRESMDFGELTVTSTRDARYEPYSVVELGLEQYLVESDEPLLLKDNTWEHKISLMEVIGKLDTLCPVDRSFTRVPSYSIKTIIAVYQTELEFYHNFNLVLEDNDDLYLTKIPHKQYSGQSMAAIVFDLFRAINAIPRLRYDGGQWFLSSELYNAKGREVTIVSEAEQSSVNDIDYATEVLAHSKNAVNELNPGIWYPSKTQYITPRTEGTMFQLSALRYELDSNILDIYKVYAKGTLGFSFKDNTDTTITRVRELVVDITGNCLEEELFGDLRFNSNNFMQKDTHIWFTGETRNLFKQNTISFKRNSKYIGNLYSQAKGVFSLFTDNIEHINNAIYQNIFQALSDNWEDVLTTNVGLETPYNATTMAHLLSLSGRDLYEILNPNSISTQYYNVAEVPLQVQYQPSRDISFITEKYDLGQLNKTTITNNQKDSFVELGRYIENNNALANRIGNEIKNITQTFDTIAEAWRLGDYFILDNEYWLAIDIRYNVEKTLVNVQADFAKNFSNTSREYSISRLPSNYAYTGKRLQSNFIARQYLSAYVGESRNPDNSLLTTSGKAKALNILDYNSSFNVPLRHANIVSGLYAISAPLFNHAGGNTIVMHWQFDDPRVAGYGMKKASGIDGTYAWYKNPVYYVNSDDFSLYFIQFTLSYLEQHFVDNSNEKFYPLVGKIADNDWASQNYPVEKDINDSLAFTNELIIYSEQPESIVIGNAFAKYNNLINEFSSTPAVKLYKGTTPFNTFDKYIRSTDTEVVGGSITLGVDSLQVLDDFLEPMDYWCLAINREIIIASNGVSVIGFRFSQERNREVITAVVGEPLVLSLKLSEADNITAEFIYTENITLDLKMAESDVIAATFVHQENQLIAIEMREEDRMGLSVNHIDNTVEPLVSYVNYSYDGTKFYTFNFTVKNNDETAAEIFADTTATPTSSRGVIASQSSVAVSIISEGASVTLYARAKAAGENYSTIDSASGAIT